jgi:CzcA family heavy metal efflux pump
MSRSNSLLALFAVLAASILGALAAFSIPSAVFPEIQFDRAIILAEAGELPAEQMMVAVTRPLEETAYGVSGVRFVRSTTTRGASEIDVAFVEGSDPVSTFQLLNGALGEVRAHLPTGTMIDTRLLTTGTFPIIDISMSSSVRGPAELTDIAQYDLIPALHRIDGVYRVEAVGGKQREYVVRLDPARMLEHSVTAADVATGLAKANVIESAGRIADSHRLMLTVVSGDLHDADQLAAIPVASVNNQPVYVRDIGHVELAIREDYVRTFSEDGPAVLVGVSRQPGGNTVAISDATHALISQFRARYPDVRFSLSYDQAALVTESFNSVRDAIALGLMLAVGVVFLFTGSVVSALVAAIVVPCTIAITFAVMKAAGMTFNMMSLGGLAAGIGLFIDDAIVMIEAIHRAHARGERGSASVTDAITELARPLIASTATVIVVFAPLVLVSGVTGIFFRTLALTLGSGLFVSLLLALYFTPALELMLERLRRPAREPGRAFAMLRAGYLQILRPFVRAPILAPTVAAIALGAAFVLYRTAGTDYLPALDEGGFVLDYLLPPPSTIDDSQALLGKIRGVLKATPEVAAFSQRTGTQLGFFLTESNRGDFSVRLKRRRSRDIYAVMGAVRAAVESTVPNVEIEFSQLLQDFIGDLSGTPEPIEVKVFGADQSAIEKTASAISSRLHSIPDIVDIKSGLVLSNPEEDIIVDQTAAARYGLNAADVLEALRTIVEGNVATDLRVGDRLYGVRVRYPDDFHLDLARLPSVLIRTSAGSLVPLSSVTTMSWRGERTELNRERLVPVVHVTGRVENTNLGAAVARVQANLVSLPLPPGVTLEFGGLYADQQKAFHQLTLVLIAALVAMVLVLLWEFGRLAPTLAILTSALASLAGGFAALDLAGLTLNISSFMGIVMVAGITAKNGILLLDHAEHRAVTGTDPREALIDAAYVRLRPILMTTLATAAGLLPLALGLGAGAKVQQPLAVAVIGGLAFALLFSTPLAGGIYLLGTRPAHRADAGSSV